VSAFPLSRRSNSFQPAQARRRKQCDRRKNRQRDHRASNFLNKSASNTCRLDRAADTLSGRRGAAHPPREPESARELTGVMSTCSTSPRSDLHQARANARACSPRSRTCADKWQHRDRGRTRSEDGDQLGRSRPPTWDRSGAARRPARWSRRARPSNSPQEPAPSPAEYLSGRAARSRLHQEPAAVSTRRGVFGAAGAREQSRVIALVQADRGLVRART